MITHYGHYKEVCEYGEVHGQCRCPNEYKTVRMVKCNGLHVPATTEQLEYKPKHRRDMPEDSLDGYRWF
jgi:hypothetical protein